MAATVRLGLRLAWGSSRSRAAAMILAGAVITIVLCFLIGLSIASIAPGEVVGRTEVQFLIVLGLVVAIPLLILLSTASRLSAGIRDRRLASLRLLGLAPSRTRMVAATESAVLTLVGALLLFGLTAPGVERVVRQRADWLHRPVEVPLPWLLGLAGVVVLVTGLVAVLPSRAAIRTPLAERRGVVRRPAVARVVPLIAGVALLTGQLLSVDQNETDGDGAGDGAFALFAGGALLCGVGLPLAIPVLVRLIADGLARLSRRVGLLLAARRLQYEPSSTARVVAGLVAALFVVAGGRSVLGAWEATPQYVEAVRATRAPQQLVSLASLGPQDPAPAVRAGIAAVGGARKVADVSFLQNAGCLQSAGPCADAIVGTCAELAAFVQGLAGCDDRRPAWVIKPATRATSFTWSVNGERGVPAVRVPTPDLTVAGSMRPGPRYDSGLALMFVPETYPGVGAVVPFPKLWLVELPAGKAALETFRAALPAGFGYPQSSHEQYLSDLQRVDGYRAVLWSVGGAALAIGLLALLIGALDRALERRRQIASLRAVGVPVGTLRAGQVGQMVLPLLLGVPLAGALGLLAGASYLAFGQATEVLPWRSVGLLTLASFALVLVVGALTLPAVGAKVGPEFLRRE